MPWCGFRSNGRHVQAEDFRRLVWSGAVRGFFNSHASLQQLPRLRLDLNRIVPLEALDMRYESSPQRGKDKTKQLLCNFLQMFLSFQDSLPNRRSVSGMPGSSLGRLVSGRILFKIRCPFKFHQQRTQAGDQWLICPSEDGGAELFGSRLARLWKLRRVLSVC
jgi:hypothetical protein